MSTEPTEQRVHSAILRLGDRYCSLPVDNIREMTVLPEVREVCGTPHYVPGVITLRGVAIPVVNLRMRLGMSEIVDENQMLLSNLQCIEQETKQWFSDLEEAIQVGSRFTGCTAQHMSELGKWVANHGLQARSLISLAGGFEEPLEEAFKMANQALTTATTGTQEDALDILKQMRSTSMRFFETQFERIFHYLTQPPRMIVTVIEVDKEFVGIIVDEVAGLAWVREEGGDISKETSRNDELFASMGRNETTKDVISMLEPRGLRVHQAA